MATDLSTDLSTGMFRTAVADDSTADRGTGELVGLYYAELKRLARIRLAEEWAGHSLQPTGLAHEAVLRLFNSGREGWESRGHFFAVVSEEMRRVLVDAARRRRALKRGGAWRRVEVDPGALGGEDKSLELLVVDDLLDRLAAVNPGAAEVVKMYYFGGLGMVEVAAILGVSDRTVQRRFRFARAWMASRVGSGMV